MILLKRILFIAISLQIALAENLYPHFLADFFADKNVIISAYICWPNEEITALTLNLFYAKNPKRISIFKKFQNLDFLEKLDNNHFVVVDLNCNDSRAILQEADNRKFLRQPLKWLVINSEQKSNNSLPGSTDLYYDVFHNTLKSLSIFVDSEVICAEVYDNCNISIWMYYRINDFNPMVREKYGEWTKQTGLKIQLSNDVTSFRRKNLNQTTIRIVCVITDNNTYNHLEDFRFPMVDTLTKSQYGIVTTLASYLNARHRIVQAAHWGVKEANGSWSGLSGILERSEADIAGSSMFFFKGRLDFGKFLKLTNPTYIKFIFRKPPLSVEQNIYSLPFTWTVWISSACIVLLITLLLILSSYYENPRNMDSEKVGIGNILLLISAAICQQGCDVVPTGVPGRTLTLLVFTALMFLYVSYSANIVALLQSTSNSIKTMDDLLRSSLKVGCHNISYNFQYFMHATDPVIIGLYKEKIGPHGYYSMKDGIERMQKEQFAFHAELGGANYYILKTFQEHEKCDITQITGAFNDQLGWLESPANSSYIEMFKIGLIKIGEYGIEQKYLKRFYKKPECTYAAASFTSVGIMDFYPALLVFLYGVFIAIFVFLMEHLHKMYVRKQVSTRINITK